MTVSYNYSISTSNFWNFHRLIFRWRGSVWQCIHQEFILWLLLYIAISASYRLAMTDEQRLFFEKVVIYCDFRAASIPITFLLGFYVNLVLTRWWNTFSHMSWSDEAALGVAPFIKGNDVGSKLLRRSIVRLLVLSQTLLFRDISIACKKRFPVLENLVEAGLMTEPELDAYNAVAAPLNWSKFALPMDWVAYYLNQAREQGRIQSDHILINLHERVEHFRSSLFIILDYDMVNLPLVYSQVAHLAVRSYFAISLLTGQFLDIEKGYPGHHLDLYLPPFTILQFIFLMGWMKVAEVGINPWGLDDDDFEVNFIIDRNLQAAYAYVDHFDHTPQLQIDPHATLSSNVDLPYTEASAHLMAGDGRRMAGSMANVIVERQELMVPRSMLDMENTGASAFAELVTQIVGQKKRSSLLFRQDTERHPTVSSTDAKKFKKLVKRTMTTENGLPVSSIASPEHDTIGDEETAKEEVETETVPVHDIKVVLERIY